MRLYPQKEELMAAVLSDLLKWDNVGALKQVFTPQYLLRRWRENGKGSTPVRPGALDATVLMEISEALTAICHDSEPEFLKIGNTLQNFYMAANELAQDTMDSVKLVAVEGSGSVLVKIKKISENALSELQAQQAQVANHLKDADDLVEKLGSLSDIRGSLQKIAKFLGIVGLNIGIEGAKSQESEEKFSGFSVDIRGLSEKVSGIGEAVLEDVNAAMTIQKSTCGEITFGLARLKALTREAGLAVDGAIRQVETITNALFGAMENTRKTSDEISRQVGDIVMAIQFHDNMRQRVEHVIEALNTLSHRLKEASADQAGGKASENVGEVLSVLEIQAAQLGRIISEIEGISENFVGAFDKIRNHLDGLGAGLTSLGAREEDGVFRCDQAVADPIDNLKNSLRVLNRLLGDGHGLMESMDEAAGAASNVAEKVSSHTREIKGISIETHLMALNAIIKSAHLGDEGCVFEVLAQEVKRLSESAMGFAADAEQKLAFINSSALSLRDMSSGEKIKRVAKGEAEAVLKTGFYEISSDYERFTEKCMKAQHRSNGLKTNISNVINGLTFLPELSNSLTRQRSALEGLIACLRPHVTQAETLTQAEVDSLLNRYTMVEERKIHDEMLGRTAGTGAIASVAVAAVNDNIELFSEEAADDSGIELFDGEVDQPSGEDTISGPDQNVVLFTDSPTGPEDMSNDAVVLFEDFTADSKPIVLAENPKEDVQVPTDADRNDTEDFGDNVLLF